MRNSFGRNNRSSNYGSRNRGRSRSGGGFNRAQRINIDKLIKKAVITENTAEAYVPTHTFADFDISAQLKQNITAKGFIYPTPIQDQAIPHILEGKDLAGIANTGTGKTGAFLIPLLDKVCRDKREKVLIIAPTRELAQQINEEIYFLTKSLGIFSVVCVGGMNIGPQISNLRRNFNFVVGTPGRIKDLIERNVLNLSQFSSIVLDEVDRMLDMGFINDITEIIGKLPQKRHSLFFSATITPQIERLMEGFVSDYVKVSVKTGETSDNINQDVIRVDGKEDKIAKLEELLVTEEFQKVLVFVKTKFGVDKLDRHLFDKGFKVNSIHGNKTQSNRKKALDSFKRGHAKVLIATDVAARGLDVPDVTHVINFDMPDTYEDYVHRIGRTGRASKTGTALTFVESHEVYLKDK